MHLRTDYRLLLSYSYLHSEMATMTPKDDGDDTTPSPSRTHPKKCHAGVRGNMPAVTTRRVGSRRPRRHKNRGKPTATGSRFDALRDDDDDDKEMDLDDDVEVEDPSRRPLTGKSPADCARAAMMMMQRRAQVSNATRRIRIPSRTPTPQRAAFSPIVEQERLVTEITPTAQSRFHQIIRRRPLREATAPRLLQYEATVTARRW